MPSKIPGNTRFALRAVLVAALGTAHALAASFLPTAAYAQAGTLSAVQQQAIWADVQAAIKAANAQAYPNSPEKQSEALGALAAKLVATYGPAAPAAVALAVQAALAGGVTADIAISALLSSAILAGAPAADTTAAVMTAANDADVGAEQLGEALGLAAANVEGSNTEAAAAMAQTVANLGSPDLTQAFAEGVAGAGGPTYLGSTGSGAPAASAGGAPTNPGGGGGGGGLPCANPSCS